jgi:uncharacterized protein YlaI
MAMKVTLWCDQCPTLLEFGTAFEVEIRTKQILPRQDHSFQTQRLHLCDECYDRLAVHTKSIKQNVSVTALIEEGKNSRTAKRS